MGIFAWANGLFVLLSAPLWLPFLDALGKAATFYDPPKVCQIQPGLFIGAFDDIFHRQLMALEFLNNPSANFFVLLGAAWAVACCRGLVGDATFRATLIVAVAAAAVAFGVVPPDLLARVPLIKNIYHFDNTFSCVLFILLFVLAGFGLRACHRRMRSAEWRGDWIIVLSIVGILFGAFLGMTQAAHRSGTTFLLIGQTIPKSEFMWFYGTRVGPGPGRPPVGLARGSPAPSGSGRVVTRRDLRLHHPALPARHVSGHALRSLHDESEEAARPAELALAGSHADQGGRRDRTRRGWSASTG